MDRPENVNIQYDQVLQLVETFKSQQHDQLDDDKLFYGHLRKCRCCFMQITEIRGPNIIHQWHRKTFKAMTGLQLSSESHHSNYLCLNCIELLRIFSQLKVAADGMQKMQNRYIEHHQQPFELVTVKQEVEDEIYDNEYVIETKVNDTNNQTEDAEIENIKVEEFYHDQIISYESGVPAKMIDELPECSVQLERLDTMTIAQYSSSKRTNDSYADTTTTFLIDHTYSLQTANNSKFNCTKCSKIFKSQKKLNLHQRHSHDVKKFKCGQCNAAFSRPDRFTEHVQVKHEGKSYHCSYPGCSRKLAMKRNAATHLRQVHKLKDDELKNYCKQIKIF